MGMGIDKLGSADPRTNGLYRLYVGGVSTLAALLLAVLAYNAKSALDRLELLGTLVVQTSEQVSGHERRIVRLEDSSSDLLQRVSKMEGGAQRSTPGVR